MRQVGEQEVVLPQALHPARDHVLVLDTEQVGVKEVVLFQEVAPLIGSVQGADSRRIGVKEVALYQELDRPRVVGQGLDPGAVVQ